MTCQLKHQCTTDHEPNELFRAFHEPLAVSAKIGGWYWFTFSRLLGCSLVLWLAVSDVMYYLFHVVNIIALISTRVQGHEKLLVS